jgi:hypothetical protein
MRSPTTTTTATDAIQRTEWEVERVQTLAARSGGAEAKAGEVSQPGGCGDARQVMPRVRHVCQRREGN